MAKTKDIFLNIAANPNMTLEDLVSVGLTSENTMLLDRALYASNEKVQDMFRDAEGNFDEVKFNTFYDIAEQSYNILANDEVNLKLMDVTAYDSDNIFVDPSKRRLINKPFVIKTANPDRLNVGLTRIGKIGSRTLSREEIAQTQEVLLNPVAVSKGDKPVYGKAPNESWFEDFWDTRVMAAWDEDGTHIDTISGKEVEHKKGDLKLNENGTYYYESLDGRSVYGKQILNKFNTLTTDGSSWNKYDFFDSDDIAQKSIGGSVLKNLALVGSMFIPYVGWGVAAASVAHLTAGLFSTFGKMLAGADNDTLNAIEGWVKSTDRRNLKTEYALQKTWCWENFIDLIGDTTAQLREQRAIFKFAPAIIKRDFKALSDKAMSQYKDKLIADSMKEVSDVSGQTFMLIARAAWKKDPKNWRELLPEMLQTARGVFSANADKAVRDYLKSYYKLGEPIARAYMTAITVLDTFGEAIQAGASNNEAALLTMGYAAAEAALLSTDLGKWIMPELRAERLRYKMLAKKLLELPQETRDMSGNLSKLLGETKKAWVKRLFNIGKDIANAEYSVMEKTVGSVLASGLGEGIEEVSEELLADFSKTCFNLSQLLLGDTTRMNAFNHNWDWSSAADRYGMSFIGGIVGGGINAAASDYKGNREMATMDSKLALLLLVYMTRNNELDDFWKVINKTTLASKELSTKLNDDGIGYKQGTKEDNLDLEAKRALKTLLLFIESIINAENAKLSDDGLLATLISSHPNLKDLNPVKDYRMRALANSDVAGKFLNEWNTINTDIVKNRYDLLVIISKYGDASQEKYSDPDKELLKILGKSLKTLQEQKDKMLDGSRTREYVRDALFEMSHAVRDAYDKHMTEILYAESKTGKKYYDISEEEKSKLHEQYIALKSSNQPAELIHDLANIYETISAITGLGIEASAQFYEDLKNQNYKKLQSLDTITKNRLQTLLAYSKLQGGETGIQGILNNNYINETIAINDENLRELFTLNELKYNDEINKLLNGRDITQLSERESSKYYELLSEKKFNYNKLLLLSIYKPLLDTYDEFITAGFIHPENRETLLGVTNAIQNSLRYNADYYIFEGERNPSAYDLADLIEAQEDEIENKKKQLSTLSNTPIVENLKLFIISTKADTNILGLVLELILAERTNASDINNLQLSKDTTDLLDEAFNVLELYRSAIVGARYDNVDVDNIVGFNTTLNEILGDGDTPKLAEIDGKTADLILEDINKVMARLKYSKNLHNLNVGNKFNVQDKTSLNKHYIIYNRIKRLVSILEDDKEWNDAVSDKYLKDLNEALRNADVLSDNSGFEDLNKKNFALNLEQKAKVEKQSIDILSALHKYLNYHIKDNALSVDKLARLLTYERFKGLIRPNEDFLNLDSADIDDNAFIWWLCAVAALDADKFYNNFRYIINKEVEGERPVAPIPTLEMDVFALTAAITKGNMFRIFGEAIRKSLNTFWDNASPETRLQVTAEYGDYLIHSEEDRKYFKNNDFIPNFDNIFFIEGIAGSGKTTGVLKMLFRLLSETNPDFVNLKFLIAHTNKPKAENLGKNVLHLSNFEAYDHDSLLKFMSNDYRSNLDKDGNSTYILNKDVNLVNGILRSTWEVNGYKQEDVPRVIFIDEWTHYNLLELELIQRFAQKYGTTVVALGDFDLLTPNASIKNKEDDKNPELYIAPHRNTHPRAFKLGVSMRTDNDIKNRNMYSMLAWKKDKKSSINLHWYEDETGIYGDKMYDVALSYGNKLDEIKLDILKMIKTLKNNETIGYIYRDENSELYKWITSTDEVRKHVTLYTEKDAHGEEALYYIIESNPSLGDNETIIDRFRSVYTGITRSGQGSILITPSRVSDNLLSINFVNTKDLEMILNTYTDEGTRLYSKRRKEIFDAIYKDSEITPFDIEYKLGENISITPTLETITNPNIKPVIDNLDNYTSIQENELEEEIVLGDELPPPPEDITIPILPDYIRTEEDTALTWEGPLQKGQTLYSGFGQPVFIINGENNDLGKYLVTRVSTMQAEEIDKEIANKMHRSKPKEAKVFNEGDHVVFLKANNLTIESVYLDENLDNPNWVYDLGTTRLSLEEIKQYVKSGELRILNDEVVDEIPDTALELEGLTEFENMIDEEFSNLESEQLPESVVKNGDDIDFRLLGFTFNTLYLADEFDENGQMVIDLEYDLSRIDNGYGLVRLDRSCADKNKLENELGLIRRYLYGASNDRILKYLLNRFNMRNMSIKWAFVSKSSEASANEKYKRFNAPLGSLMYMGKEDTYIPLKTISAIIYNENGEPVLEFPVVCLRSPHIIFRELRALGIGKDIVSKWKFGKKEKGETKVLLDNIMKYIEKNHYNHPGYMKLRDVIRMWLFSNNGFKTIPNSNGKSWNLHDNAKNLGNLYVTSRYSDDVDEHNYVGEWKELNKHSRKDKFISSIMMNNSDTFNGVQIFPKYVPYVFESSSPLITNDLQAAARYLAQQQDASLEKIVKVFPASPPEISVEEYIRAMYKVFSNLSKDAPYGNKYSPYRIWEAILKSPNADVVLSNLKPEERNFVIQSVQLLNKIKEQNPIKEGESKLQYKVRLALLLNPVIEEQTSEGIRYALLRNYLVSSCFYKAFGTDVIGNDEVLKAITEACKKANITGILCKTRFSSKDDGAAILGFAYKVKVENDSDGKYNYPGHGSFRKFAKTDPPTYDITELLPFISNLANEAEEGLSVIDKDTKLTVTYPNIWHFVKDESSKFYLPKPDGVRFNINNVLNNFKDLFDRLGINLLNIAQYIYDDCNSETQAKQATLEEINRMYLEQPGSFIIKDADGNYKYGNILTNRTPEFEKYKFEGYSVNQGKYILRFTNTADATEDVIEIDIDMSKDAFELRPKTPERQRALVNSTIVDAFKLKVQNTIDFLANPMFEGLNLGIIEVVKGCLLYCNDETGMVDIEGIKRFIGDSLTGYNVDLILNEFELDELSTLIQEKQQDYCINPIKIKFK